MNETISDVVIIGGGPAGLYASFYGGLRGLNVTLLEVSEELGGKLNFYPEKFVWDVGALPPTKGKQIKQNLIDQASTFGAALLTNTKVTGIGSEAGHFTVTAAKRQVYSCRAILFATGGGIVTPVQLDVPIARDCRARIHYVFPNQQLIQNKKVVVTGGGNSAVDYANDCLKLGCEVTLLYRGNTLKAHEAAVAQFIKNGGHLLLEQTIRTIHSEGKAMLLELSEADRLLSCDHLIVQYGHQHERSLLSKLPFDFATEDDTFFHCEQATITNVPGIFAAGDVHRSASKLRLLAGAFQDGAYSINQIKTYLTPESPDYGKVSSHNPLFAEKNQQLLKD